VAWHPCRCCRPIYPTGCTNAVTAARLYSTADRRRLPAVLPAPLWQRSIREEGTTDECGASATTAMWPAVWHGGRPSREAAGPLPAGSALALCRSASGGKIVGQAAGHRQVADRYEAAGGCGPSRRHGSCPNEAGVSCQGRDRCGAPGAALAEPRRSETFFPVQNSYSAAIGGSEK
jgi:hypothetical protein